jgi:hypothetical protein
LDGDRLGLVVGLPVGLLEGGRVGETEGLVVGETLGDFGWGQKACKLDTNLNCNKIKP